MSAKRTPRKAPPRFFEPPKMPYEPDMSIVPGDHVLLINTRHCGATSRVHWVAQACDCAPCISGSQVAVDEASPYGGLRHVGRAGLQKRGTISRRKAEDWTDVINVRLGMCFGEVRSVHPVALQSLMSFALTDSLGGIDTFQEPATWKPDRSARVFVALDSLADTGHALDRGHYNLAYIRRAGAESTALYRWSVGLAIAHGVDGKAYADAVRAAYEARSA